MSHSSEASMSKIKGPVDSLSGEGLRLKCSEMAVILNKKCQQQIMLA